jgi:membrane-associated phospholipid phosphatase
MADPAGDRGRRTLKGAVQQAVVLAVVMLMSLALYLAVLWWRGPQAQITTQTAWDRAIPFRPAWVWVYLIPYALGPLIAAFLTRDTLVWYIRRGIVLVLISVAVFAILPTKTERPSATDLGTGPTAQLYRNMVAIDGPAANAAPSLHVSLTCLLAWALVRDFSRWWAVCLTVTGVALVWLSTLLTWQHHLIDVATGVLLGSALALPWPGSWVPYRA